MHRPARWMDGMRPLCIAALLLLAACNKRDGQSSTDAAALTGGNPYAGREKIREYGCDACHTIPGVPGADALVGPPLAGIGGRMYIAGILTNTPEHMVQWILDPRALDSATAMPKAGATETDARDIAAYLYTLSSGREP